MKSNIAANAAERTAALAESIVNAVKENADNAKEIATQVATYTSLGTVSCTAPHCVGQGYTPLSNL
jgi:hypothetical protein